MFFEKTEKTTTKTDIETTAMDIKLTKLQDPFSLLQDIILPYIFSRQKVLLSARRLKQALRKS
ncbi:hypothetical protein MASR1M68_15360 [Elusimicrobiota bacterium]